MLLKWAELTQDRGEFRFLVSAVMITLLLPPESVFYLYNNSVGEEYNG
jgi:hypothetical protein